MSTYLWQRRRSFAIALGALSVFALILLGAYFSGPAHATSGGDPYVAPEIVDTNPDPNIIETTIIANEATVDVGNGVMAHALTFNGSIPGPLFKLKVGDTIIVHFENQLAEATGIHWHGIELDNASDGTPLSQNQVPPGGKFLYKFKVTRPGVYWYHPHHHSSTNQVFKGLYGQIIITDAHETALQASGVLPPEAQTLALTLSDMTVCNVHGSNADYDAGLPWVGNTSAPVGGPPFPGQTSPTPANLCEGDGSVFPLDEDGNHRGSEFGLGDIPNIQRSGTSGRTNEGHIVLTNGKNVGGRGGYPGAPGALAGGAATYDVQAGQGLRLRLVATTSVRFFRLRLTGTVGGVDGTQIPLVRVGGQGGLLDSAVLEGGHAPFEWLYDQGEIVLDPGDRADVVVAIPGNATGTLTLWTQDFNRTGQTFANTPTVPVAHFNVSGSAGSPYSITAGTALLTSIGASVEALGGATGTLLDPTTFSPVKTGLASQDIRLTQTGSSLGVNDKLGMHDFPGDYTAVMHMDSARFAKLGDILELTVTNTTDAHHPFHLHGFSIQPLDLTGSGLPTYTWPYHDFRDNVDVPGKYTLRFRVRLDDRPLMDGTTSGGGLGRWVFHCHIFFHASNGMISEFDTVRPGGNERPYINADGVEINANSGDSITMHGTYHDPDGDTPIGLSASHGTITDDGDGLHWTWTDTASTSGLVYVTATDPGGSKDQVAFETKVNQPPVVTATGGAGDEGSAISIHGTAVDPDGDPLTQTWTYAPGVGVDAGATCAFADASALDTTITCTDDGPFTVTLTASDGINAPVSANAAVTVANVAPLLSITSPPDGSLYIVGTTVAVAASVTDPGTNDSESCAYNWDGGGTNGSVAASGGVCTKSNTFTGAGVYTVSVTATDDDGGVSTPKTVVIVIYDPNAGFVTGGGTVFSAPGTFTPNPAIAGQANFGFNNRYQKSATVPSGQVEFNFQAGGMNFHSTGYEWLVVAGAKSQIRGFGQVNNGGNYGFLLTITDGQHSGGGGIDKLRMKIWDKNAGNAVIYDNSLGSPDDMDIANPAPISSGSIVIH